MFKYLINLQSVRRTQQAQGGCYTKIPQRRSRRIRTFGKARFESVIQPLCLSKCENPEPLRSTRNIGNTQLLFTTRFGSTQAPNVVRFQNNSPSSSSRAYSKLTHVSDSGTVNMVDVGDKAVSKRTAKAEATVHINSEITALIRDNLMKKGDVLTIAKIAGIMGAKRTHELIPLCHSIALSKVDVEVTLDDVTNRVVVTSCVVTSDRTGVEMEAIVGAMVAAATVYDMCKAVSKAMVIGEVRLLEKTGGVRGNYKRD